MPLTPLLIDSMENRFNQKKAESGSSLFCRLIRRHVADDVSSNSGLNFLSNSMGNDLETSGADASTSETEGGASISSEEYVRNTGSLLSLQPWIFQKTDPRVNREVIEENGVLLSPRNGVPRHRLGNSLNSLRCRHLQRDTVEPLAFIESCFTPHLYNENLRIDEYVFGSLPSPLLSTLRPISISDGRRIISRSSYNGSSIQPDSGLDKNADEVSSAVLFETPSRKSSDGFNSGAIGTSIGFPPLPISRKSKRKIMEIKHGRSDASDLERSHKFYHSEGSLDGMMFLCLGVGITVGMVFTLLSNRIEVEKLNKLLKHSGELVKDLQEELEMKDSLTVKEITDETCESRGANRYLSNVEESTVSSQYENPTSNFNAMGTHGNPEELSKIEAELEAELERLEQNINAFNLQENLNELDPDLIGEIIHGELTAKPDTDDSPTTTSTAHVNDANYAVPPKDLSLRLHELIQSRLEERIEELETALLQSQRQLQSIETEWAISRRDFSNSDMGSSSNHESPTALQSDSPLCLNLPGYALDAYGEAYEEFTRVTEVKNPPSSLNTKGWIGRYMFKPDQSSMWELEGCKGKESLTDGKASGREAATWDGVCWSGQSGGGHSEDDISDDERLIQQILEKNRQGSPVLTYAQRMLSLLDQ